MKLKTSLLLLITLFLAISSFSQDNNTNKHIIKVLSFNIYHGETMNHQFDLDIIAKVINDAQPDFVAMQEVDKNTHRAKEMDLTTELAIRTGMAPLFGKAMDYDGGEYGEGVLSKHSFLQTQNIALPYSEGNEPRAALKTTTILPWGDTICFIGTHLDHLEDDGDRVKQAQAINKRMTDKTRPCLLAGDLNDTPNSQTINILEEVWESSYNKSHPKPTYPSVNPSRKIDYVMFYPKNKWRVLKTEVIQDSIASDHCAYLVTLELLK